MKRLLLLLALTGTVPAMAADLPAKIAAPIRVAPAPAPSGWWVSATGMGSVLRPGGGVNTLAPAGFGAGVGAGYDAVLGNGLIAGISTGANWVNVRGTATCVLVNCTAGNTWEFEVGPRIGFTFGTMNGWLGNSTTFQNVQGKLVTPLQPIPALNQAMVYLRGAVVFQGIQASVAGVNDSRADIGYRAAIGVEMPVLNQISWKTEGTFTKFNDSVCGGCILTTGRPHEWGAMTGPSWKF